jgi:hypothetical protein
MNDEEKAEVRWVWGRTKAEMRAVHAARTARAQAGRRAKEIAAWRRRNPEATCSDWVAAQLVELEGWFGQRPERG